MLWGPYYFGKIKRKFDMLGFSLTFAYKLKVLQQKFRVELITLKPRKLDIEQYHNK